MSETATQNLIAPQTMGTITLEMLKKFAISSGDYNPIHQEESVAKSMGLPGVIAHGMLISSFVTSRVLEALTSIPELSGHRVEMSHTRFRAMTFLGDVITVSGHWALTEGRNIRLELVAKNQREENVITAYFILETS